MTDDIYILADANNLIKGFRKIQKASTWKCSTQKFEANLLSEINNLQKELLSGTYKPRKFSEFTLRERGKVRHIKAPHIRDRVVFSCLCDEILIPRIRPYLIYDNGASLKNKGVSFSRKRLEVHLRKYYKQYGPEGYIMIVDISKYFDSINNDIMKSMFLKHVDSSLYKFMDVMFASFGDSLPIGAQPSQIGGVYYMHELDNYCKIVQGLKYYGRYNDDIYIIHPDKDYLRKLLFEIEEIISKLGLKINPKKSQIIKLTHGFTYMQLQYKLCQNGYILRKMSRKAITRERRKLKRYFKLYDKGEMSIPDIIDSYESWRGNAQQFASYETIENMDMEVYLCLKKRTE